MLRSGGAPLLRRLRLPPRAPLSFPGPSSLPVPHPLEARKNLEIFRGKLELASTFPIPHLSLLRLRAFNCPSFTGSCQLHTRGPATCHPCPPSGPQPVTRGVQVTAGASRPRGLHTSSLESTRPIQVSGLSRNSGNSGISGLRLAAGMHSGASVGVAQISEESLRVASDGKLRLATFSPAEGGAWTVGAIKEGKIWPLKSALSQEAGSGTPAADLDDMVEVITSWSDIAPKLVLDPSAGIPLATVRLGPPVVRLRGPVMCIGKNYAEHVKEVDTWKTAPGITEPSIPQHPIVFTKAPQSVIGPGDMIQLPPSQVTTKVDYETELALIIGKEGRAISEERAMDHVFGYTILNDVTARDVQKLHQQWFIGKSCDTFCPMGPWIVPASEIDGQDLQLQCWINEEPRQNGRTSQLIFPIPTLIATISKAMTLRPGDIIATGTPSGVGSGFNPPRHLKKGDIVRMRIEGIGELINPVGEW